MDINDGEDLKILIDALKYTSNIIVNITNKLTEQDEKIKKIEDNLNKLYIMLNNTSLKKNLELDNQIEKIKQNDLTTFIIEKTKDKTEIINSLNNIAKTNKYESKIPKDRNKIDKLINSIVKRKKILSDIIENNNEKSLLTDYNTVIGINDNESDEEIINRIGDFNSQNTNTNINFTIKTSKSDGSNIQSGLKKEDEEEINKTGDTNVLKTIRKRSNFAKRF